jgi:hypothetical protein
MTRTESLGEGKPTILWPDGVYRYLNPGDVVDDPETGRPLAVAIVNSDGSIGFKEVVDPERAKRRKPEDTPVRAQVLREAERLVCGDREGDYGDPTVNLHRIAQYWTDYLYDKQGDILTAEDVALMMILMKVARQAAGYKRDSVVDIAGYAAIAAEAAERKVG